jgi:hypothetical protein
MNDALYARVTPILLTGFKHFGFNFALSVRVKMCIGLIWLRTGARDGCGKQSNDTLICVSAGELLN